MWDPNIPSLLKNSFLLKARNFETLFEAHVLFSMLYLQVLAPTTESKLRL